ncbi:MAG: hybrid sensor histidine kinase/response regulator [Myxococcota bacterium]
MPPRSPHRAVRDLLDRIPEPVFVHRDWRFLHVNPAAAAALGYDDPAELAGADALAAVDPADLAVVRARGKAILGGEAVGNREIRVVRRDGTRLWLEMASVSIDFEGAPAIAAFARDVTARRTLETRMLQAERLLAIGTLAGGVAHEIANPLTWVLTNVDYVSRELTGRGPADVTEALRDAREGLDRVLAIVRDMRLLARPDMEERQPADVRVALEAALSLAQPHIRHRARVVRQLSPVPRVLANETRLGQVFLNVLRNAGQAIPYGAPDTHEVRVRCATDRDGRVRVEVVDTGEGMSPAHLARVFDPFFTTRPPGEGMGLGLSVAQAVVAACGGEIAIDSQPGAGTVVRVLLPPADVGVAAVEGLAAPSPGRRARVLVVDDEEMMGASVRRALSEHDVVACTNGLAALGRLRAGERYDVLVCDLHMPVMTGMELHRQLVELEPELARRTVFITGAAASPEVGAFLEVVANARLMKPVMPDDLRAAVRGALT